MFKHLRFFNKNGEYLNFGYDETLDKWTGRIDFLTISEGLAETASIFIFEEVFNTTDNQFQYSKPLTLTSGNSEWSADMQKVPKVSDLFMFQPNQQVLEKLYSITFETFSQNYVVNSTTGIKETSAIDQSLIQINFGFIPSEENKFESLCTFYDGDGNPFLELTLYGEGEGEDERLRDLLMNLGCDILPSDSIIFDQSEVKEQGVDWTLINRKRKELLLEYQNIFPYTGSYKALINILKFYGYQNVHMKEYWKNVDMTSPNFGKYRQTDIIDLFSENPDPMISNLIPSKIYKKTNLFGLFYDITVATNEFDEDGIPIVEEVFTFTPEEVLIKLFALKRKLMQYYLPLNAKIIDIIGEAIYFANYRLNITTSQNRIDAISLGIKPTYDVLPGPTGIIQDLRALQWLGAPVGPDIGASGFTMYKYVEIEITNGATATPLNGYADLYLKVQGMTSGRVRIARDPRRGRITWTRDEIREELVESFNNPTYIPGFNNQNDLNYLKDRFYAYPNYYDDVTNPGFIRIVEKVPTVTVLDVADLAVDLYNGMSPSNAPAQQTETFIDPSTQPISTYLPAYIGYFNNTNIPVNLLNDAPGIAVGYPIVLKNTSFDISWDDANVTFNQVDVVGSTFSTLYSNYVNSFLIAGWTSTSVPVTIGVTSFPSSTFPNQFQYSWENLGYYGNVEMQWIVTKDANETLAFYFDSGQKPIFEIIEQPLILPYVGEYTVKLKIWDSYNMQSFIIDENKIKVEMADADFIGWYTKRELDYKIDQPVYKVQSDYAEKPLVLGQPPKMLTWDDYTSTWDLPLHPNEAIEMAEITGNSLDSIEFYQTMENPISNPLVDRYPYRFNLIGDVATWDDAYHLWWDNTGTRVTEIEIDDLWSTGATYGIIWMTKSNTNLNLYGGNLYYVTGPTGWQGATASGVGYTAGDITFVSSIQKVYVHNGNDFALTNDVMDALVISVPGSTANMKASTIQAVQALNSITEQTNPLLSEFIYYYNEKYDSNYALFPYIKAVSKDFDKGGRHRLRYENFAGSTASYETVNFGYLGDIPAHFEICEVPLSGGSFEIEYISGNVKGPTSYTYTIPAGITTLSGLANELNGSTAQGLPVIGDFVYNLVLGASGWTGGSGPTAYSEVKVQGVLKQFTNNQIIEATFNGGVIGTIYGRSLIKNPTWDDLRIYKYTDTLPLLTTVNFTYDNSKIKGKTQSMWKLTKEDDLNFSDIYYNNQYFSYMFNQKGSYTLSLTLEDTNGNKKTVTKPEIIKIV
jgi:hypothetical protein